MTGDTERQPSDANDPSDSFLLQYLESADFKKQLEDGLVDLGVPRAFAKPITLGLFGTLKKGLTGIAQESLQGIDSYLKKFEWYDKLSFHAGKILLQKVENKKIKDEILERYIKPVDGEDPDKWSRLDESTRTVITQLSQLDFLGGLLEKLQADVRLKIDWRTADPKKADLPSELLPPYMGFIPLIGREREKKLLREFCMSDDRFKWQVLIGDAGMGKTRLALEFATEMSYANWIAGFMDSDGLEALVSHPGFRHWQPMGDTLIVFDYAASRVAPLGTLIRRFAEYEQETSGRADTYRLRLLLLERHADSSAPGWLNELCSGGQGMVPSDVQNALYGPPLELKQPTTVSQENYMTDIVKSFFVAWKELTQKQPPELPQWEPESMAGLRNNTLLRPLYLQIAALKACKEGSAQGLYRWTLQDLLQFVVDRERAYLRRECPDTRWLPLLERLTALLGLIGPISPTDKRWLALIRDERDTMGLDGVQPKEISDTIFKLSGGKNDSHQHLLLPLQPDIVRSAFIAFVLKEDETLVHDSLHRALDIGGTNTWAVLLRTAQDLYGLVECKQIESWMIGLIEGRGFEELDSVEAMLPLFSEALSRFAVALEEYLLSPPFEQKRSDVKESQLLNNLGVRYYYLGRHADALAATERAVEIHEKLAAENPAAYEPDLAGSLNNLGIRYRAFGRHAEALAATERAVEIREKLAAENPAAYEPDLAGSLTNLGEHYSCLGRHAEALAATKRSVDIREKLAAENPAAYEPDLAASLDNLGVDYSAFGRHAEALAASERAKELYEKLAAENPAAYLPNLAMSYGANGSIYRALEQHDTAAEKFLFGIRTLRNAFFQNPGGNARLMEYLIDVYPESCQAAGLEPDMELLLPILAKLQELESDECDDRPPPSE